MTLFAHRSPTGLDRFGMDMHRPATDIYRPPTDIHQRATGTNDPAPDIRLDSPDIRQPTPDMHRAIMDTNHPATPMHRCAKDINGAATETREACAEPEDKGARVNRPATNTFQIALYICPPTIHIDRRTLHGNQRTKGMNRSAIYRQIGSQLIRISVHNISPLTARKFPKKICLDRQLTRRDNQVLQLLGDGLTNEQIANRLGIGVGTLGNYFLHLRILLPTSRLKDVRRLAHEWALGKVEIYVKMKREHIEWRKA